QPVNPDCLNIWLAIRLSRRPTRPRFVITTVYSVACMEEKREMGYGGTAGGLPFHVHTYRLVEELVT
ncbi:hypothetical protein L249_1658, partial [Ophiocordyceps polyrhachis-furcata BCC 54312]